MPPTIARKVILISLATAVVLATGLFIFWFLSTEDLSSQLRSLGYDVEIRETTFRGYESQNISADKNGERLRIQTVNNVEKDKIDDILAELALPIVDAQKDIIIFDPYTGQEITLSVPEQLKPLKKETTIEGQTVEYALVHANIILSMRVYSEVEIRYRGLFATYFCKNDSKAYKLEMYYPAKEEFNEEKATNLFSSLYCSA